MNESNENCPMCRRITDLETGGENPFLIHEFPNSFLIVGDHQFFHGYCQLIFKKHAREMHELEPQTQAALFAELMLAGQAVARTFQPWKMNYSCYGNVVPHIHWHLFPRYDTDPDREQIPWFHADEFNNHLTDEQTARRISSLIRQNLDESQF